MKLQTQLILSVIFSVFLISTGCTKKNNSSSAKEKTNETVSKIEQEKQTAPSISADVILEAALNGQVSIVKDALDKGYNPDATGANQRTALMLAAFNGHTEIVKALLDAGASVSMRDDAERTALMFASTGDFLPTVELLIKAGSDVNAFDGIEHFTPLMFACGEGLYDVAVKLMEHGADKDMLDIDGESAYDFAVTNGHTKVVELLRK